jgi:Zn-dependent oligopeptidase
MNKDLFDLILRVKERGDDLSNKEDRRLLERLERDFRRNGMALDKEYHSTLRTLKKKLADICLEFQSEINEDKTTARFTERELDGLPRDFLDSLEIATREQGEEEKQYILTMKYPDLLPVMRKATREETRFQLDQVNHTRCKKNLERLKEVHILHQT